MNDLEELFQKCLEDPQFESEEISQRPLRGPQAEIIKKVEAHVRAHKGGVMTILSARQTGKNEISATLQRRHLTFNQHSSHKSSWIRTAPTHEPQIVNSKKRLEEVIQLDRKNIAHHPLCMDTRIQKTEGYIWRLGNATVEFMSSGPHSNVVGATASECLDMDEAHQIGREKFDEDFAPFTASTDAATLLWGVAADGLDTIESYRVLNEENKRKDLNLRYPCEIWMEHSEVYASHVKGRERALGWEHPIMKTQYRLIPVANEGTFLSKTQSKSFLDSEHDKELSPRPGKVYEIVIDIAAGNEDLNPNNTFDRLDTDSNEQTATDSTVVWIYEVTEHICQNNIFPIVNMVSLEWWTGVTLPEQEIKITELIRYWKAQKVTIDGVGVGRQMAEALEQRFGPFMINKYIASGPSVSEDCFDLLARLNYGAVKMFRNDGSREWLELERQLGWTKYASKNGKMSLMKPGSDKHIDMVKALTYIGRNKPNATVMQILSNESEY
jgi:hypothetical protein